MSIEEYIRSLRELSSDKVNEIREEAYIRSGNALLANIKNRIQREGKDSSGQNMPLYSQKPSYFTRDQFVQKGKFKPVGKNGTEKTKVFNISTKKAKNVAVTSRNRERKSMYLSLGYSEFRYIQGRPTNIRTLNLSGDLMKSYVLGTLDNGFLLGFDQDKQSKKRQGLESKNGSPIFIATSEEMKQFEEDVLAKEKELVYKAFGVNQ